jgi:predicted dehydrogenase
MLRVYGTKGGFHWRQDNPNYLFWSPLGQSTRIVTRGGPDSGEAAARVTRVPPGHPEGYLEGFANIYSEVALGIKAARVDKKPLKSAHFPTIDDGVKGLEFVEAAVKSSKANGKWVKP